MGVAVGTAVLALPAAASAATVTGTVFNDYNTNGTFDRAANGGAVDRGVAGLTVRVVDAAGNEVASTTSAADGSYSLTAPEARVRIELEVGSYEPSRQLGDLRSDERFVDAATAQSGIDFGVHIPTQYSVDNPTLWFVNQYAGPVAGRVGPVIKGLPYFATDAYNRTFDSLSGTRTLGTFGQLGTVFGLAQDQVSGDLFAGAYYKRFSGLTNEGPGAIFKVTQSGDVTPWARLVAGSDGHPVSARADDWFNDPTTDRSWDQVGKTGLGAVEIDQATRNLYTVNLSDKTLVRIPLDSPSTPVATPIPSPDTACETTGRWLPFSVGVNPADGTVFVGGVCNAETSQDAGDLHTVVYRVENPTTAPTFTQVLNVPLDYDRIPIPDAGGPTSVSNSDWQPWPTGPSLALDNGATTPSQARRGQRTTRNGNVERAKESYPQLTAISFDADGSMQLGFRDMMGDMSGVAVPNEGGTVIIQGDLLRACPIGAGAWQLEDQGRCGGVFGATLSPDFGPIGPGGRYFYSPETGLQGGGGRLPEPSAYMGGLQQVPGFAEIASTGVDTARVNGRSDGANFNVDGLLWQSNVDGEDTRGIENRKNTDAQVDDNLDAGFGKSNGLGDLAAWTRQAPIQIGNRIWRDNDGDGVQDADEPAIPGVVVRLFDDGGNPIGETTTDAEGEYVFDIAPGTSYRICVPLDQAPLAGLVPTQDHAGSNGRIDSDGTIEIGCAVVAVGPHGAGENDHSFDIGFRPPTPPQNPPVTPPANPPANPPVTPPTPPVTPKPKPNPVPKPKLTLAKTANHASVRQGALIRYTLTARNTGKGAATSVRLCDDLPDHLTLVTSKATLKRAKAQLTSGRLCWNIGTLKAHANVVRTFVVRVDKDAPLGSIVNRATLDRTKVKGLDAKAQRPVKVLKSAIKPSFANGGVTG